MSEMTVPAIICRGDSNGLARTIATAVDGEVIIARGNALVPAIQASFRAGRPVIAILPSAVMIRAIAPILAGKHTDPPLVSVSHDGKYVVPLIGLRHGGHKLAAKIAEATHGFNISYAATDQFFRSGTALDHEPDGYCLLNVSDYKPFATAMLDGESVQIEGVAPWLSGLPQSASARLKISVTDRIVEGSVQHLVINSKTLAVGVGCERGTDPVEVKSLVEETLRANGLSVASVAGYGTIDLKEDEPAITGLSDANVRFFSFGELEALTPRVKTPSGIVREVTGTSSVCESAALALAGPDSELIVAKTKSRRTTCAVARAAQPILELPGRERGWLSIIGLGPGSPEMRTFESTREIWAATDLVGYSLYLELIQDKVAAHHTFHSFALGEEEARVRHAIALAKTGKRVALVCSGDPGIYAMAALVYEIIDLEPCRIAVEVIPGISAFQAAAAKAGAMIGHDFCCISLSDLLTPRAVIEKRIKAAAEGDFVVAFYNPRSLKRRDLLERAMAMLAEHRPPDTPVVIAANLHRPKESVRIVPLHAFNPEEVDMLTLVMVGSSQSKAFQRGDGGTYAYTPRGYAQKRAAP